MPSHMSGVVGHKPTYGIVPAHGHIPGPPGTLTLADLDVAGPMARSVEDLELGLDVIAGPNRWERPAWQLKLPPPRARSLKEYRVAAWLDDPFCRLEPELHDLLEKAADALANVGVQVDREARPAFTLEKVVDTFFTLLQAALAGGVDRDRLEEYAIAVGNTPASRTKRLLAIRHREWLRYNERRLQMRRRWEEFFANWDAMLLPATPCPAIPHDHSEPMASRIALVGAEQRPLLGFNCVDGSCRRLLPAGNRYTGGAVGQRTPGRHSDRGPISTRSHDARFGQTSHGAGGRLSTTIGLLNRYSIVDWR